MTFGTILISLAIVLGALILFLIGFILLRTMLYSPPPKKVNPRKFIDINGQSVAERIALAVQFKTISNLDPRKIDENSFLGLHRLLTTLYPKVHANLKREIINDYSLLYTWEGTNPDLEPIMLISHLDVVPADEGEQSEWTYPPFSGKIADGYVWGRGTMDIKNGVIGILEAVAYLLKEDFIPERTIYLGFGHDEEVGGKFGAAAIASLLESRGVELGSLLDEGVPVIDDFLPDINQPVGFIGISEKGYLSLRLVVSVEGGHSSMPPQETAIGILSKAIANLENSPLPAHLEVVEFLMSYLGSALPFTQRMIYANTWLFGSILKKKLAKMPMLNAMMRTTTAPTIIHAGVKDNVLPGKAEAVVNFRILPGDDLRSVYEMVLEKIDDPRVKVSPFEGDTLEGDAGWDPSAVADTESPFFMHLFQLIEQAYPEALVSPYLVLGGTDSRQYMSLTDNAFRFVPMQLSKDELDRMHGVDERLSIENCAKMVSFYIAYLQTLSGIPGEVDLVEAAAPDEDEGENTEEIDQAIDGDILLTDDELAEFEAARAKLNQDKAIEQAAEGETSEEEHPEDA